MVIHRKKISFIAPLAAVLAACVILGLWRLLQPRPDEDSAAWQRMMDNLRVMAVAPHPAGSAEIDAVRAKLVAEIEGMGVKPLIENERYTGDEMIDASMLAQDTTLDVWWEENRGWIEETYGITSSGDFFAPRVGEDGTMQVQNILVKLDAPGTDRGVMLVSHYDSTIDGPGAADDMVAVCAMLEAMRLHAQNTALENDLYFLFTDGEEDALLGAWRFAAAHTDLRDKIDMAVNFEARGNRGNLLLFETSPGAYPLLKAAVESGAEPVGFSWLAAVYSMMPNITDLTVFLKEGYKGVNFAVAEGVEAYHQPADTVENLDRRAAWQYLRTALALADYAANRPLDGLRAPPKDAVYFSLLPGVTVLYDNITSHILCAAACAAALLYMALQIKRKSRKALGSLLLMGLLGLLSILCDVFFTPAGYLFYLPLLCMALAAFLEKWPAVHRAARGLAGLAALLLWTPAVFLIWISLVQPMLL